jgi:small-conductance mechanosensitive channel
LLFERKIRVGDIVEVDSTVGVVSEINTRSSIIRGFNGVESLVPNALFLENRVVNWTLNNRHLLREIKIGVAYGSPTQEVIDILRGVAERHGLILKKPEPFATLSGFGDNSLDFTLYFWVEIQEGNNRLVIDSDLRIMIEKCLREAGISIPFQQRDLHLGTSKPLQIQIQSGDAPP